MNADWQTWAAAAVVIVTALIFVWRAMNRRKSGSSCGSCGSTKPVTKR